MCFEAVAAVGTLLGGAASIFTGLSGKGDTPPSVQIPPPSAPAEMPAPNDEAVRKAGQRRQLDIRQRSGRASNFLSELAREKVGSQGGMLG